MERHKTPEYRAWADMRQRCTNPRYKQYKDYGGRGISVCAQWESFEKFLQDVGKRPGVGLVLDRIDNESDYEPGNCRWATKRTSQNNTRKNSKLTLLGRTRTIAEWSRLLAIPYHTLVCRVLRGWMAERALTQPVKRKKFRIQPEKVKA